ncbi:Beta-secretase 2 [Pteropus alecto]|uniref:Beta-secretase 2 n=1 Tax=Pteropus alecto TaxID=9402 RepID=L5K9Y4_PTEAL|nr:Beta-secretase 2 [Pteropus alecto]
MTADPQLRAPSRLSELSRFPWISPSVGKGRGIRDSAGDGLGSFLPLAGFTSLSGTYAFHPQLGLLIGRSSTYRPKGFDVTVKYTQGSWAGLVGEDVVTIPKGFNGSFVVNVATIFESENFFLPGIKWNGILGLAYAALAKTDERTADRVSASPGRFQRRPRLADPSPRGFDKGDTERLQDATDAGKGAGAGGLLGKRRICRQRAPLAASTILVWLLTGTDVGAFGGPRAGVCLRHLRYCS